jgi:hypothetical protein
MRISLRNIIIRTNKAVDSYGTSIQKLDLAKKKPSTVATIINK